MKSIKLAAMAAALCLCSAPVLAQNSGIALLKKMEGKFAGLKSVAGSFSQTRTDPTFKTKVTLPARFQLLKPSYFRAEYEAAAGEKPSVQLITDQMYYNYTPQLNQVTTYKFKGESNVRDLNYLLLGFGAKADEVEKVYHVKPLDGRTGVQLTPRNPADASFKYITMEVDPQSLYPTRFTMRQPDNTDMIVVLNLSSLQINPRLSPSDFAPNFGRGVHTVSMQ